MYLTFPALDICRKLESQGDLASHAKDTAWLYKSLFNLSLDGLNRWSETEHIVEGFTVAVEVSARWTRYANKLNAAGR